MSLETPNISELKPFSKKFDLKQEVFRYVKKWYLFLISFIVFLSVAYVYIRYTVPQYRISATLFISEEESLGDSALNAFQDLGISGKIKDKISSEIQLLKSKTLIKNVVEKFNLNIMYFSEGRFLERESYPKSEIEINFLSADSIVNNRYQNFNVLINSKTSYSFINKEGVVESTHSFGKTVTTDIGNIILTPSERYTKKSIGNVVKIKISPVERVVSNYRNKIQIFETKQSASVVNIALNDPSKEKAKDIINDLINEYQKTKIAHKQEISNKTADFIDDRITLISNDLTTVDDQAAGYKSQFKLTNNLGAQTQRIAGFDSDITKQIEEFKTELRLIESMQNYIQKEDIYNPIPANLGFNDPSIISSVGRYNVLIQQRARLLKTSSAQNPVVVNIDEQITNLRQILSSELNSLKSNIQIQLNSTQTQGEYFSDKLYVAPTRQKDLREIEREQTVKEQLYLYLLQKREEAKITEHITIPNSRIIDKASTLGAHPVSPNKKGIYIGALFIGFMLPFSGIYLQGLFDTKIRSKSDLEGQISIPILDSIPKSKQKNKIVIEAKSRESIAEAFRILRTNLDFLLTGLNKEKEKGKVIFVTSSISGEGKTFISSNIAKTLAIYGSKVAYVGTDFRYPRFHEFLDLPNGKMTIGFTNYIMDSKIKPEDVLYCEKGENPMYILPSGTLPPNPSGLLMQPRTEEMFRYLEDNYDYVVVDTAPTTLVTDTLIIAKQADLSVYVIREGFTDKRYLEYPESYKKENRLKNIAILLNGTELGETNNYGY